MKDKQHGQLASLTQTRNTLVKLRTTLKNKINNILSARGMNLPKEALSSEKKLNEILTLPLDALVQVELRVIVAQIRSLNKSIAELKKSIAEEASKLEGHKSLISIKGIGKITSAVLLSVIGDVGDFPDESRLASYFGIVPRVSNSNGTERSGRIHKRGSKLGRTALIQSALIAVKYSPYLKNFYQRVKAGAAPARPLSRWRASFLASFIERSKISGSLKTFLILCWPNQQRSHEAPVRSGTHHQKRVRLVPASLPSPISSERRAAPPKTRLNPQVLPKANQVAVDKTL